MKKATFTLRIAIYYEAGSNVCVRAALTKFPAMHRGWISASSLAQLEPGPTGDTAWSPVRPIGKNAINYQQN